MKSLKAKTLNISEFKAKALRLLDETFRKGAEYIVTRKGIPVAKVSPIQSNRQKRGGSLKGLVEIKNDIVYADFSNDWDVTKS